MGKINFLDCTLRDGGYYNSWDFEFEIVNKYLQAVKKANVNIAEIGFRSLKNDDGFKGAAAFATDEYIDSLTIPRGLLIAVMINASEIIKEGKVEFKSLNKLVPKIKKNSNVDIIRIACHFEEFKIIIKHIQKLKDKGYKVGVNLMQIGDRTEKEIESAAELAGKYLPDVLYFADSLGNMDFQKVISIIKSFRKFWSGDIGIHAHDNMSLALSNTLYAIKNGVNWVDSTITGMGRGPGNTQTELLAFEISDINNKKSNLVPIINLIESYFSPLKNYYKWGTNSFYYLSGKFGIHPTYIQEMLQDKRYSDSDIINAINHLKLEGGKSFSRSKLGSIKNLHNQKPSGTWNPKKTFNGKDIFLVGPGPSTKKHIAALNRFIKKNNLIAIALNNDVNISEKLINYRVTSHPIRIISDIDVFSKIKVPLIAPLNSIDKRVREKLKNINIFNYGIKVVENKFSFDKTHCILPNPLVLSYCLAIFSSGRAKRVYISGFDGYELGDPRKIEVDKVFELFYLSNSQVEVISVTPTLYRIPTKSIYSL